MGELDHNLFLALNFDGGSLMDRMMFLFSGRITWVPLYLLILYLIYRRHGWKGTLWSALIIAAAVGLADQACNLFKDGVQMLRPNHTLALAPYMHFPLKNGVPYVNSGLYGTVSAHAATTTAIAFIAASFVQHRIRPVALFGTAATPGATLTLLRRRWFAALMAVWVAAICYSRIYIGAHFPSQILFGITLGLAIGAACVWIARKFKLVEAAKSPEM